MPNFDEKNVRFPDEGSAPKKSISSIGSVKWFSGKENILSASFLGEQSYGDTSFPDITHPDSRYICTSKNEKLLLLSIQPFHSKCSPWTHSPGCLISSHEFIIIDTIIYNKKIFSIRIGSLKTFQRILMKNSLKL